MWIGKTLYPEATVVFSQAAHYSIYKFASLLNFDCTKVIRENYLGQIDLEDLAKQVSVGECVVLVLTAGTTMTSAYDDINNCMNILKAKNCKVYLHLDAALGGLIVPFINESELKSPESYTFKNPAISSLTVSMHKVLGTPMPANIFICRQTIFSKFKDCMRSVPYLSEIKDVTLYGSRDGFRALAVSTRLENIGYKGLASIVETCLTNIKFILESLWALGVKEAFRAPGGLAVVLPLDVLEQYFGVQGQVIAYKYRLVRDKRLIHMYVMGHITRDICNEFVTDCKLAYKLAC
ncbi:MAG: hypothetical protein K0R49_343 [Burkholderiales bacterium]|nr:hypothetical protein [Burkholderiales bacterium]